MGDRARNHERVETSGRNSRRHGPRSAAYLASGTVAVVLSLALGEAWDVALLSLVQFSGSIAVLAGVWLERPVERAGWIWLGAGAILLGAGAASWFPYVEIWQEPIPYPGWSDALFVPGYLMLAGGLAVLIRRRSPARQASAVLDALILATGLGYANWVFLTGPASHGSLTTGQRVITIVYPAIDVLLVALVARLLLTAGRTSASLWLLAAGAITMLGGDTAYAVASRFGGYRIGDLPDQLWMMSLVFVGAAALHPSMVAVTEQVESEREGTTNLRLALMMAAMQLPAIVIGLAVLTGEEISVAATGIMGAVLGLVICLRVAHLATTLRRLALVDALTGLPTRDALIDELRSSTSAGRRDRAHAALYYLDLDHFKSVNDAFGHAVGDRLLVAVAGRLRQLVDDGVVVARVGGDEFAILYRDLPSSERLEHEADRIVDGLGAPFTVNGHEMFLGASIGVVLLDGTDPDSVLRNADIAMYAAKASGRSRWELFVQPMFRDVVDAVVLNREFRRAIDDELVLHYQPIIDVASGRMVGTEALVRWQHPTRGLLGPDQFVPAAENDGLIVRMGARVLTAATEQLAQWHAARPRSAPLQMSVNLSAADLSSQLLRRVTETLAQHRVDPAWLCLEVTETALLSSTTAEAGATVAALRQLGVSIAIDDFGTGYASFTYLQRLDVDFIKIDKSFVAGLGQRVEETTIVATVIGLAKAMGLSVIAEGVESAEQLLLLRDMGCDLAQGYYLSHPVPAGDLDGRFDDNWLGACGSQGDTARSADELQPLLRAVPNPPATQRYRVVLADDDRDDRMLQRRELEATGRFDVVGEGSDGGDAVRLAALHQPHLVLLDLKMPNVDGLSALPRLLLAAPGAKIVLLAGHASPGAVDRALAIGATAFHKKGVPDLAAELLTLLDAAPLAAVSQ